ncbi:helitron helicase-like domain-containing protein [Artemisia annua]|uniref:Helitron helicase-like domain-containing protein n=1 Tax=Artemisia annua TaxID=35608 RepID=A0A2U1PKX8_ARTAN|nr:helitron helicase-like domain-containing protein [Artemisia annua]
MPRRLLRNDFAPLTNTYMHTLTHNNGYEKKQLVENENDLHYNGTLITDNQVSTENDNFIHTMRHHVVPSNVNSSRLDLYGQQQNLSITDTQISAENDKFIDKMQHHVGPSNVNNTNLDLYGQPQNLSIPWKNQPFYQQSTSTTNKQSSNQIDYLGESNATISDNLGTKKDATYIPDKRKRRIATMFKDVTHHAKRSKESSNNKGKTLTFEGISMHAQPADPYETVMPENAANTIDQGQSSRNEENFFRHIPTNNRICNTSITPDSQDMSPLYIDIGDCQYACQYCNAAFWYSERSKESAEYRNLKYTKCCAGGQVYLERELEPPIYLKQIFKDKHFLDNIRAYNQMFSMTSFGAQIDDTINDGRGPYVFKISGQIHHWIGTICPTNKDEPKFMQIYMLDTDNEVAHRMEPFGGKDSSGLKPEIVQHLIQILDANNELVQVFRTARDRINEGNIGDFKIQLYNVVGNRRYDLPSSHTLGAIVFEPDGNSQTDYDIIIEYKDRQPQRINKLHSSYMSLQYPLIFVYGQPGFNTKMTLDGVNATTKRTKMSMNMFYKYQLHERICLNPKTLTPFDLTDSQATQEEYTTNAIDIPQKQQLALAIQTTPPSTPPSNEMSTQINLTGEQPAEESTPAVTPPPNEISAQVNPMEEQAAKELAPTAKAYTGMQTRSRTDAVQTSNIHYSKTVEQTNIEPPEDTDMTHQNEPVNTPVQPEDCLTDAASKSSTSIANKPTSSKRALFQGKTADAKKNKKE